MKPVRAEMMTGNMAAAWGARLAEVDYVAAYPITPQSEIVETLSKWIDEGAMDAEFVMCESEHSMLAAAGAASLTGVRAYSATSSQGLVYAQEMLYTIAGWRAPMVLVNVARGLGMPMVLHVEHGDVLGARDTGFLQIHAENCQEVLDSILIAYRIAEDKRILLPVIVNLDGFLLSFTREPVEIPEVEEVRTYLPPYRLNHALIGENSIAIAPTVLEGYIYSYFRYQLHLAALKAKEAFYEASADFTHHFGRSYGPVETYMLEDADYAIICSNSYTSILRGAVDRLRKERVKVGLLKLRLVRPFPREEVGKALEGLRGVAVFDQNIAPGRGGILYPEVVEALYHRNVKPRAIVSFIGGLGGKTLSLSEVRHMLQTVEKAALEGTAPPTIMLYRKDEWAKMVSALRIAGKKLSEHPAEKGGF